MTDESAQLEILKQRARAGDPAALAELRARGFFAAKKAARGDGWPLSAAQRRLWIIDQMRPGLPAYNMPDALQFDGALDVAALRAAVRRLVERHETLRTTITTIGGEPRQIVGSADGFSLREVDLSGEPDPLAAARKAAADDALAPFDLARGPLFRVTLVRMGSERHLLLCTLHHIVSDAWSTAVLRRELAALYTAGVAGAGHPLPPLRAHYRDFAAWQNRELAGPTGAAQRDYWRRQLGGERAALALPTDFPRPAV
ncbi:MAG: hypothetical protein FJ399_06445, partial [Verrucomicrobia bacterium]|nr:hypothetical protein [Verrucomicrobiota bacterium]